MGVMTTRYVYEKTVALTGAGGGGSTLKTGLVSWWEFDEASGTRVDSHSGGNDLTDNNTVTQAVGKVGNAAQFTSANSESLSRATNSSLQTGGQDFSLAGWFYMDTTVDSATVVSKGGAFANREYQIKDVFSGAHRLQFTCWNSGGTQFNLVATTGTSLSTGSFFFFAVTFNNTTKEMTISVNNSAQDTTTLTGSIPSSTGDFTVGTHENSGGTFWNGRVDQLGFWKKVLTTTEIAQLYNSGNGLSYASM